MFATQCSKPLATKPVIPRAQEVLRPYLVARRHNLRPAAAFASVIAERPLDLITVLILFGLHLFVFSDRAARAGQPLMAAVEQAGALAAAGALGVLAVLFAFHWRAEALLALAERLLARLPAKLAGPLLGLLRSFGERSLAHCLGPEILRLEAALLLRAEAPDRGAAEAGLRKAIELACGQNSRSLELRAATDLARLLVVGGRRDEALSGLAGVYRGFTEGFDTTDLRSAPSALLDELGAR